MRELITQVFIFLVITVLIIFGAVKLTKYIIYSQPYTLVVYEDEKQVCIEKKESKSNNIIKYCLTK